MRHRRSKTTRTDLYKYVDLHAGVHRLRATAYDGYASGDPERTVQEAMDAFFAGPVPVYLQIAFAALLFEYENKSDLPHVERAERLIVEAWDRWTQESNPQGIVYKG